MITDSLKRDFKLFVDENMTIAGFMRFLKYHTEAIVLLNDIYSDDYSFLIHMSDEAIHKKYDSIDKDVDSPEYSDCMYSLYCFMNIVEEDDDRAQEIRSFVKGFTNILSFQAGIPNVCNIRIGDEFDNCWLDAVQDRNTGIYEYDSALDEYNVFVDDGDDYNDTFNEIIISMPLSLWSYEDIKELYAYISREFHYEKRNASYSFDSDNDLSDVDIELSNSLYGISIYNKCFNGNDCLIIKIAQQQEEASIYQALNTLLKTDLTPFMVRSIHKIISVSQLKESSTAPK